MKKLFLYSCIFIFLFLSTSCSLNKNFSVVEINNQVFKVELAQTSEEKYQGFSNRKNLTEDSGMLFIFDDYTVRNFVMRDMNFPLDIVWIKDNWVVDCEKNVPILAQNGDFSRVNSKFGVNLVLEINAGLCDKYDISTGDRVDIKY